MGRGWVWKGTLLLVVVALALAPALASTGALAAPICPGGTWTPDGCVYKEDGMVCAWPLKLARQGRVTVCVLRQAQPGEVAP
jgi:hypothetical protein